MALGGGAAVAAHGGDDEGFGAEFLDLGDRGLEDLGDAIDAAAAGGEADAGAGLDGGGDLGPGELLGDGGGDVGDLGRFESLADFEPAREGAALEHFETFE